MTGGTGTCHTSDFVFATCVKSIFQDIILKIVQSEPLFISGSL